MNGWKMRKTEYIFKPEVLRIVLHNCKPVIYDYSCGHIIYWTFSGNYCGDKECTFTPKAVAYLYRPRWIKRTYYEAYRDEIV